MQAPLVRLLLPPLCNVRALQVSLLQIFLQSTTICVHTVEITLESYYYLFHDRMSLDVQHSFSLALSELGKKIFSITAGE